MITISYETNPGNKRFVKKVTSLHIYQCYMYSEVTLTNKQTN